MSDKESKQIPSGLGGYSRLTEGLLDRLSRYRPATTFTVLGLSALPLLVAILAWIFYGFSGLLNIVWGFLSFIIIAVSGLVALIQPPGDRQADKERVRGLGIAVLGLVGFTTTLLGLLLPFTQPYRTILGGGLEEWHKHGWTLAGMAAPLLIGTALSLVGLQLGRVYERREARFRVLLYGYNTVFSCLLLLAVLAIPNILAYSSAPPFSVLREPLDWTVTRQNSLSDKTKAFLRELKQPVMVYAILSDPQLEDEARPLLDTCSVFAQNWFKYEIINIHSNRSRIEALIKDYGNYLQGGAGGMLVVVGTGADANVELIKEADMVKVDDRDPFAAKGEEPKRHLVVEGPLLKTMEFLSGGKERPRVYFTQGNGELNVKDRNAPDGAGLIFDRLAGLNYEPLVFDWKSTSTRFPDDADMVVIARPNPLAGELPAPFLAAVEEYLQRQDPQSKKKKGRLVVLFDVTQRGGEQVIHSTGLEERLGRYGVRVKNSRILTARPLATPQGVFPPTLVLAVPPARSRHPVAQALAEYEFPLLDVRPVEAIGGEGNRNYQVDELLVVPEELDVWETDDLSNPGQKVREMQLNPQADRLLSKKPIPVAATVAESGAPNPGHSGMGEPRLAVFGDASWITNNMVQPRGLGRNNPSLLINTLDWLRGRTSLGFGPEDVGEGRTVQEYSLVTKDYWRLVLVPPALLVLCVLALGGSVWVARRR
jgi:hypothetical protein